MQITIKNNKNILIKDNNEEVNIDKGEIIEYNGIYYKTINNILNIVNIETLFIGVIDSYRYKYDTGITGIYIKPMYIWNIIDNEWNRIINYESPKNKYFLYPHLLSLPQYNYDYKSLNFLNTCINKSLDDIININININKEFTL